ncbi:MAG TPA: TIGR01777 family oxidoreductase [Streptosporangiaceae bacterium]|jgi:hypothetical protein
MSLTYTSVVDAPVEEVFAWHGRPGAITRLMPPWQPVSVVSEAASLRDGRAELRLPGGIPWVAEHQPDDYDPPHQFADKLVGSPVSFALPWRHTHRFAAEGHATRVTDTVDTAVPAPALRAMFRYRHAQLAGDLASQARARDWLAQPTTEPTTQPVAEPITVAVTGANGLVGTALTALLTTGGHRVVRLTRGPAEAPGQRHWDPDDPAADLLDGVDAVIHLAGASIAGRFTDEHKAAIRDSRLDPTRRLAHRAATTAGGPRVFVSASAIGYYGPDRGDEVLTEDSPRGKGFLADVVAGWEDATHPAAEAGLRCVQVRTGIVQSPKGGTLQLLRPLFATGLGGRIGDGRQWLSWIGLDDLADIYLRAVCDSGVSGPVNAVAPQPVRNAGYTRALAATLRRPALLPVPALGPRLLLGEQGAAELALASQRVEPTRLLTAGHHFRYPELSGALGHLLGHEPDRGGRAEP